MRALRRAGRLVRGESGRPVAARAGILPPPCACCDEGGGEVRCYRMVRCGTVQCPPPNVPAVRWACSSTPPAENLVVIDQRLLICYRWDGQPPLPAGTPPPPDPPNAGPLIAVVNGACASEPCTRDLCSYFLELQPCTQTCSFAPVRVFQRLSQYRGAVPVGFGSPTRVCCYCAGDGGAVVSSAEIPPGSIIVSANAGQGRTMDCCACRGIARTFGGAGDAACGVDADPPAGPTCCCGRVIGLGLEIGTIEGYDLRVHESRGCVSTGGLGRVARCSEIELRSPSGVWLATIRDGFAACGMRQGAFGFDPGMVQVNPVFDAIGAARIRAAVQSLVQVFQVESSACDRITYRTFGNEFGDRYVVTWTLSTEGRAACLGCGAGGAGGAGGGGDGGPLEWY